MVVKSTLDLGELCTSICYQAITHHRLHRDPGSGDRSLAMIAGATFACCFLLLEHVQYSLCLILPELSWQLFSLEFDFSR